VLQAERRRRERSGSNGSAHSSPRRGSDGWLLSPRYRADSFGAGGEQQLEQYAQLEGALARVAELEGALAARDAERAGGAERLSSAVAAAVAAALAAAEAEWETRHTASLKEQQAEHWVVVGQAAATATAKRLAALSGLETKHRESLKVRRAARVAVAVLCAALRKRRAHAVLPPPHARPPSPSAAPDGSGHRVRRAPLVPLRAADVERGGDIAAPDGLRKGGEESEGAEG
jgi:hypothetical protein